MSVNNMKTAVIDVGSNSVRYALITPETVIADKELKGTVLADGLFFSGGLAPAAMARTIDAIDAFCRKARLAGADEIFVFATEAVRSARNGKEFVDGVLSRTGIAVDVIDGATEAEIGFLGASPDARSPVAVFDIGGASCEIVCGVNGEINYKKSRPIGCVRLRDGARGIRSKAEELIARAIPDDIPKALCATGIGGSATALGAMAHCPDKYDPQKTHACMVTREFLEKVADRFFAGENMKESFPCLTPSRAAIIGYGALAAMFILDALRLNDFTVSERDNMEGYYEYRKKVV